MPLAQLISAQQLRQRLGQENLLLLDCRFALEDPSYGRRSYLDGHLPEAHFVDLEQDLSAPVVKGVTGRHPLPDPSTLIERLRACGLRSDSQMVLYDDGPGAYAARAWWLLLWLGKRDHLYLLDGGLKAWREAGFELTTAQPDSTPGDFPAQPDSSLLLSAEQLAARLDSPDLTLLDARALPRFRGEVEPLDPVAGHIPRAQCAAFTDNLGADGRFLPAAALRERFDALRGERPLDDLVAYCGSGVTACHNLFAMSLAGYPLAALYAGSWSEWITNPAHPIATGD